MIHNPNCLAPDHRECNSWYTRIGRVGMTRRRRRDFDIWAVGILGNRYVQSFTVQLGHRYWIVYWIPKEEAA